MLSQFCIQRPIFATVLAILIVLAGVLAWRQLPLSQYPDISPPSVRISAQYEQSLVLLLNLSKINSLGLTVCSTTRLPFEVMESFLFLAFLTLTPTPTTP